jgi:diaminohydroxyphosphoribosylaminopyrimidine deaminase / 5-amino-6-(5-phosphoribosylamino)uracil reductase
MSDHDRYIGRCIELASHAAGYTHPNPMVGAVLVHAGEIISEGYHRAYGQAHAEVDCLERLPQSMQYLLPQSTLYVNLEPCSHHGKTPPCADMIIARGIRQVVVGALDPYPLVAGQGVHRLRKAGIDVVTPVLEPDCRVLNKRFYTLHELHRPYIILKWAQSADGYLAPLDHQPYWLTCATSRTLVHKWRATEQAILIGAQTAIIDDPQLNTRLWAGGRSPIKILIDPMLRVPLSARLYSDEQRVIVYNTIKTDTCGHIDYQQVDMTHGLASMLADLHSRNIASVMIEGGAATLQHFIDAGLWDEARVFTTPSLLGKGLAAPRLSTIAIDTQLVDIDSLSIFLNSPA